MITTNSRGIGSDKVPYQWECPKKHLPNFCWTKEQLRRELDEETFKFFCSLCNELFPPTAEEKAQLRNLLEE